MKKRTVILLALVATAAVVLALYLLVVPRGTFGEIYQDVLTVDTVSDVYYSYNRILGNIDHGVHMSSQNIAEAVSYIQSWELTCLPLEDTGGLTFDYINISLFYRDPNEIYDPCLRITIIDQNTVGIRISAPTSDARLTKPWIYRVENGIDLDYLAGLFGLDNFFPLSE